MNNIGISLNIETTRAFIKKIVWDILNSGYNKLKSITVGSIEVSLLTANKFEVWKFYCIPIPQVRSMEVLLYTDTTSSKYGSFTVYRHHKFEVSKFYCIPTPQVRSIEVLLYTDTTRAFIN